MGSDTLTMTRGDVAQHYPIKKATWGFAKPAPYSVPVLCFAVETERQKSVFPGEENWAHEPTWHLDVWMRGLNENQLLPGSQFSIPECFDEFTGIIYTMFHYDESEGTEPNTIKIKNRQGDFLDLSIEGFINDKHASMEPTRMTVEARFTKCTPDKEIQAQFNRQNLPPHEPPYKAMYTPPSAA
jgi:hypothetical protein